MIRKIEIDGVALRESRIVIHAGLGKKHILAQLSDTHLTLEDGSEATISAGEKMVVTETDKVSFVGIETQSGTKGTVPIEPDVEEGWGFTIYGENEYEYFDYVPYAD